MMAIELEPGHHPFSGRIIVEGPTAAAAMHEMPDFILLSGQIVSRGIARHTEERVRF